MIYQLKRPGLGAQASRLPGGDAAVLFIRNGRREVC